MRQRWKYWWTVATDKGMFVTQTSYTLKKFSNFPGLSLLTTKSSSLACLNSSAGLTDMLDNLPPKWYNKNIAKLKWYSIRRWGGIDKCKQQRLVNMKNKLFSEKAKFTYSTLKKTKVVTAAFSPSKDCCSGSSSFCGSLNRRREPNDESTVRVVVEWRHLVTPCNGFFFVCFPI